MTLLCAGDKPDLLLCQPVVEWADHSGRTASLRPAASHRNTGGGRRYQSGHAVLQL